MAPVEELARHPLVALSLPRLVVPQDQSRGVVWDVGEVQVGLLRATLLHHDAVTQESRVWHVPSLSQHGERSACVHEEVVHLLHPRRWLRGLTAQPWNVEVGVSTQVPQARWNHVTRGVSTPDHHIVLDFCHNLLLIESCAA